MKKLVSVIEVEYEGFNALLGENVMIFSLNYIYAGTLAGVNDDCVLLENASIVYETGELKATSWKDAQLLPHPLYVQKSCIESYSKSGR